jgi:hypothetical protein
MATAGYFYAEKQALAGILPPVGQAVFLASPRIIHYRNERRQPVSRAIAVISSF